MEKQSDISVLWLKLSSWAMQSIVCMLQMNAWIHVCSQPDTKTPIQQNVREIACGFWIFYLRKPNTCLINVNLDRSIVRSTANLIQCPAQTNDCVHFLITCTTQIVHKISTDNLSMFRNFRSQKICFVRLENAELNILIAYTINTRANFKAVDPSYSSENRIMCKYFRLKSIELLFFSWWTLLIKQFIQKEFGVRIGLAKLDRFAGERESLFISFIRCLSRRNECDQIRSNSHHHHFACKINVLWNLSK